MSAQRRAARIAQRQTKAFVAIGVHVFVDEHRQSLTAFSRRKGQASGGILEIALLRGRAIDRLVMPLLPSAWLTSLTDTVGVAEGVGVGVGVEVGVGVGVGVAAADAKVVDQKPASCAKGDLPDGPTAV